MGNTQQNQDPTVSVVMAVRDGARYVAEAVESVLSQTFGDLEIIIVDDGSTDDTGLLLRRYAERDPRVRVVSRPATGLTASLNVGLRLARGQFVARMDADDIALPARLERQVAFLRANPDVLCVGCGYVLIDGRGRPLRVMTQPADDQQIQALALRGKIALCHPTVMLCREAVMRIGGYDERFPVAQDLDLWLRLGETGKLANMPDVLLHYRQHAASISEQRAQLQFENMRRACELAWARRGLTDILFERAGPWRGDGLRPSRLRTTLLYGWWAFNSGQRRTALIYGARAVLLAPLHHEGWRLLLCSVLKRVGVQPFLSPGSAREGSPA